MTENFIYISKIVLTIIISTLSTCLIKLSKDYIEENDEGEE
jgi:hypothetical protein